MTLNNRQEAQEYILAKLRNIYSEYRDNITLDTTFDQLEKDKGSDFVGAHLFIDIEEDLGVEITEDEAEILNGGSAADIANYLVSKLGLQ